MVVTHKVRMDLEGKMPSPWIEVKQWDTYTREVWFQMFSKNEPWEIPENTVILICYRKPDGKYGEYDTLPNGETAWKAEGNSLHFTLTPQMLTTPGKVYLQVCMIQEERILHTFSLEIYVRSSEKRSKGIASDDYFFMTGVLPAPLQAEIGQFIRVLEVDERGRVLRVEAAEAPTSGAVSEQRVQSIVEEFLAENPPASGEDGFSPDAKVVQTENGAVITVTDQSGTTTATILHGNDGLQGPQGETGAQGEKGKPGVYILSEGETIDNAPADAEVVIDPSGEGLEAMIPPKTAAVGQTIAVKAVDANGKPTEWEAVNFPEGGGATSWEDLGSKYEEGVVLAETSPVYSEDMGNFILTDEIYLTPGKEYTVNWNGKEYICICQEITGDVTMCFLGNAGAFGTGLDTGEPFGIAIVPSDMRESMGGMTGVIFADGSESITLSIKGIVETITPIPAKYMPMGCVLYSRDSILYKTNDTSNPENILTKDELKSLVLSGAALYWYYVDEGVENYFPVRRVGFGSGVGTVEVHYETGNGWIGGTFIAPNTRNV